MQQIVVHVYFECHIYIAIQWKSVTTIIKTICYVFVFKCSTHFYHCKLVHKNKLWKKLQQFYFRMYSLLLQLKELVENLVTMIFSKISKNYKQERYI